MVKRAAVSLLVLICFVMVFGGTVFAGDPLRVMSFNIRYANPKDGANRWEYRRGLVASTVRFHRVEIFGVQEALAGQMADLHTELRDFDSFGSGRDGRAGGERSSIFFDRRRVEKVQGKTFWLSPTPDRPSRAWGASLNRICTWGEFRLRGSDRSFFVFNTHFDHRSGKSRVESAKLLVTKIADIAGTAPVVLMGDLNCNELSVPYRVLTQGSQSDPRSVEKSLNDARLWAAHEHGVSGTFSGWDPTTRGGRIDYVLTKNDVQVLQHGVVSHGWSGRAASDHRPVVADLELFAAFSPESINLNHLWRFLPDPENHGQKRGYHEVDRLTDDWKLIEVGEPWERQGYPDHDGVAYYRKHVFVPESWRGKTIQFHSGGIADAFTLYLNGVEVHSAGSAKASVWNQPFRLHLAGSTLRYGEENVFAVRVVDTGGWGGLVGYPVRLTTNGGQPTASAAQFELTPLVPRADHGMSQETRRIDVPVFVPPFEGQGWLRVGVGNGYDDSGDKGVRYALVSSDGKTVHDGLAASKAVIWFEVPVTGGSSWTLVVTAQDTSLRGEYAGNGLNLQVQLKRASEGSNSQESR